MEEQGKQRLRFTIGIVVVVLVLVRLVVGTSDEDSTLSRAASAQLAAAEGAETTEPAPTPSPTMIPPPPPIDENIVAMEAVPDEELIDDASGSDPSELTEDSNPGGGNSTPSRRPSGPRVAVDYRAF